MLHFFFVSYLAFLLPVAVYCLVLALVNRRSNPTMVSGMWDGVGLVLACSGFLLFSGPGIITTRYYRQMTHPFGDQPGQLEPLAHIWLKWFAIWIIYYLIVLVGSFLLVWSRRYKTVVYNVEPELFEHVFTRAIEKLNLAQARTGNTVFLGPLEKNPEPDGREARRGQVEIEPFPAMCHVTLHWHQGPIYLREEIETELRRNLDECRSLDNPGGTWFLGLSTLLFGTIFLVLVFFLLMTFLPPRPW